MGRANDSELGMGTSASSSFCAGGTMIMGGNGFTLAGASAGDDCVMLWTEAFTVNSLERAVLANVSVFLLALLAQFLTTTHANRMQRAKHYGKLKRLALAGKLDPESAANTNNGYATDSAWRRDKTVNGDERETAATADPQAFAVPLVGHWEHFGDSVMHGIRILVAYLLMLAAMTYDIALVSSTVAGFMVGFFFFTKDTTKVPESADPCCS